MAYDGQRAIAELRKNPPDFIFCDVELPGMAGGGHAQPDDRKRAEEAGFDGHLAKPSDPELIENILSQRE